MIELLTHHHAWIVFLGAFLLGETLIIPAAVVAAQGHFSVLAVAGWSYLGTVASDAIWFSCARPLSGVLERNQKWNERYTMALAWINRRFGDRPERALLFIKFLYGTRIATIVYLALRRLRFKTFISFNAMGTAVWVIAIVTVGWLVGKGIANLQSELTRIEYLIPSALLLALILKGLVSWASKRTLRK
ncbi:MAG: VTT domain-containing protein [Actinobacteria bacterium]|nr:VTT domain-containing protein [Actinomycetota bacterium]